jgi:hypothetical protein
MKHDAAIAGPHNVFVGDIIRYQNPNYNGVYDTVLINKIYRKRYYAICINSDDDHVRNRMITCDNLQYWRKI